MISVPPEVGKSFVEPTDISVAVVDIAPVRVVLPVIVTRYWPGPPGVAAIEIGSPGSQNLMKNLKFGLPPACRLSGLMLSCVMSRLDARATGTRSARPTSAPPISFKSRAVIGLLSLSLGSLDRQALGRLARLGGARGSDHRAGLEPLLPPD